MLCSAVGILLLASLGAATPYGSNWNKHEYHNPHGCATNVHHVTKILSNTETSTVTVTEATATDTATVTDTATATETRTATATSTVAQSTTTETLVMTPLRT
ncbi:uncharacterized protein LOC122248474 [Penaeus japonicus]|uniref:uncharacterized protein LOC122248474 n=1 Tax=Penaeus japonicus TaxID=27405 RepID=UPI001C70FA2C|nr:uncharacterized protein LOC122248474 [Penaeus japonicus]